MPSVDIIIWGLLSGATVCATGPGLPQEVCKAESGGKASFPALLPNSLYRFTLRDQFGTVTMSYPTPAASAPAPCPTPSPDFLCLECERRYDACALSDFQKWQLITKLRKKCGNKCKGL